VENVFEETVGKRWKDEKGRRVVIWRRKKQSHKICRKDFLGRMEKKKGK
jgi:hypothetical protein